MNTLQARGTKRTIARILVAVSIALLLTSCLGIEVETRFNADGSGTMHMRMRVSKAVLEMAQEGGDDEAGLNIPLSKEDIEAEFKDVDGVRLIEVNEEETDEDLILTSTIEFDSLDTLVAAEDSPIETASLKKEGDLTVYSVTIGDVQDLAAAEGADSPFGGAEMDDAMIAMVQAFLEGYFMEYRVTAPKKVVRYNHGEVDESGKTVTLRMPMADYFMLKEPYQFEVAW